jgi:N-acetylneuraminic acid mutarotase
VKTTGAVNGQPTSWRILFAAFYKLRPFAHIAASRAHPFLLFSRQIGTRGQIPTQRANHSSALLEDTGEIFIFGGWNGKERLNDVHILDTKSSTWSRPHIAGVLPHPRAGATLTALDGRLFLFGGSGAGGKWFQGTRPTAPTRCPQLRLLPSDF